MDSALSELVESTAPSATPEQTAPMHGKLRLVDSDVLRRLRRNRTRIVKFLPDQTWLHELAAGRKIGPSARDFFPDSTGPINVCSEDAEFAVGELVRLNSWAERTLASEPSDPTELADAVRSWLDRYFSADGLFTPCPWHTGSLLVNLWQLRTILQDLGWAEPHEKHWTAAVIAALRLGGAACLPTFRMVVPPSGCNSPTGQTTTERPDAATNPAGIDHLQWLYTSCNTAPLRPWRNVVKMLANSRAVKAPEANSTGGIGVEESRHQDENHGAPPRRKRIKLPEAGIESDVARIAVLRSNWSLDSPVLAVDFASEAFALHFQMLGQTLICGQWNVKVIVDDQTICPAEPWKPLCWFTDEDGLYLELQQRFDAGVVLDRQLFLARKAPVMLLADTVKANAPSRILLEWGLPVRQGISLAGEVSTRAQTLGGVGFDCRLIPAGMPASPFTHADGSIAVADGQLKLSLSRTGSRLIAPLVWQWDRQPLPPQFPWKPLTVTNDGRVVGADEAFAVRVPLSDGQLIFYRSLDRNLRRAYLGHQTTSESVIGRLDRKGDLKVWLMVE